jgi:hypothetical protein
VNDEQKEKIQRMRAAIRKGRDERKQELEDVGFTVDFTTRELSRIPRGQRVQEHATEMNYASGRGMLEKVKIENRYGEQSAELGVVKDREPYQKRPSVRAHKKSRGNSP